MAKKKSKISKKKAAQATKKAKQQRTIAFIAVAVTFAIVAFLSFTNPASTAATVNAQPAEISTGMAHQKIEEGGAFLLDVRTPEEWVEYHVDGATLIPLDELEARVSEVPADQEVVVMCNSGNRSSVGRDILLSAGHTNVTSIAGGIQGWMSAGYPFVTGQ